MKDRILIGLACAGLVFALVGVVVGLRYLISEIAYGNTKCAFAHCVRVVGTK